MDTGLIDPVNEAILLSSQAKTVSSQGHGQNTEERLAQLEAVFDAAPVGLAWMDLDFRYKEVNRAFAGLYRMCVEDFVGRTVAEALPASADQIVPHLERCLASGTTVQCEVSHTPPGSTKRMVLLRSCQPVRNTQGEMVGLSAALIDITERKDAEAALCESEDNYRHAVELSPHIPWTCEPDGLTFKISSRWTDLTSLASGAITLEDWAQAPHPADLSGVVVGWMKAQETSSPFDMEYRVRCAGGEMRWIRARGSARLDASGQVIRWYGTNEDITDKKQVEAALLQNTLRLERVTEQLGLRIREDHLTGLANRRHFDDTLSREVHRVARQECSCALVLLDADCFKNYNDSYGHLAGDDVLRHIGAILRKVASQPMHLAARYGGEEFAILLPQTSEAEAVAIAEEALALIRSLELEHVGSPTGRLTMSAGVAVIDRTMIQAEPVAEAASHLIRAADVALYAAKDAGRDQIRAASSLKEVRYAAAVPKLPAPPRVGQPLMDA